MDNGGPPAGRSLPASGRGGPEVVGRISRRRNPTQGIAQGAISCRITPSANPTYACANADCECKDASPDSGRSPRRMKGFPVAERVFLGARASRPHGQWRASGGLSIAGLRPGRAGLPPHGGSGRCPRSQDGALKRTCMEVPPAASALVDSRLRGNDGWRRPARANRPEVPCARAGAGSLTVARLHGNSQPPRLSWIPAFAGMTPPRPVPSFPRKRESIRP